MNTYQIIPNKNETMFDETLLLNQSTKESQSTQNIISKDNDSEYDSKQDFLFHSVGTGSFNSACQSNENSFITGNFNNENINNKIETENVSLSNQNTANKDKSSGGKTNTNTNRKNSNLKINMNDESSTLQNANANDATIRGDRSSCNPGQMDDEDDSISILSEKRKKVIVRIVTIFSIIFFLICFAMIAFTLRMSEKIDAQIREEFSGTHSNIYAVLANNTKTFHSGDEESKLKLS